MAWVICIFTRSAYRYARVFYLQVLFLDLLPATWNKIIHWYKGEDKECCCCFFSLSSACLVIFQNLFCFLFSTVSGNVHYLFITLSLLDILFIAMNFLGYWPLSTAQNLLLYFMLIYLRKMLLLALASLRRSQPNMDSLEWMKNLFFILFNLMNITK